MPAKVKLRVNTYSVVARAVEEGAAYGVMRAFKHSETPPREAIRENVEREIMNALCEVVNFEGL